MDNDNLFNIDEISDVENDCENEVLSDDNIIIPLTINENLTLVLDLILFMNISVEFFT
ncbi:2172_t:CDS:2 [Funneliformis mosseae]|uniref:2172_t:CDS:1 n=1 Tax=Funneliformis mosseae TaxID=27381 RepID=A0A9N8Z6D4_FUNMO|nr:2172_t:CDS:2 [Funneliformis mosseae]